MVLTVFNQASIIERVIQGILTATAGPYELVVVFDGCTDDSAARSDASVAAWAAAREGSTYATTAPSADRRGLVRYTRVVLSESRFETLANNVGLEVARADHVVVIQDDMLVRRRPSAPS